MPGHRSMARFKPPQSKGKIGLIPAYPNQFSVQKAKLRVTMQNHCHKFYHARNTGTMFWGRFKINWPHMAKFGLPQSRLEWPWTIRNWLNRHIIPIMAIQVVKAPGSWVLDQYMFRLDSLHSLGSQVYTTNGIILIIRDTRSQVLDLWTLNLGSLQSPWTGVLHPKGHPFSSHCATVQRTSTGESWSMLSGKPTPRLDFNRPRA